MTRGGGGVCRFLIFSDKGGRGVSRFLIFSDKGGGGVHPFLFEKYFLSYSLRGNQIFRFKMILKGGGRGGCQLFF